MPITNTFAEPTPWPHSHHEPGSAAFLAHSRAVRAVVGARLGEDQAIDDVVQEVALAVASRGGAPPERWGAWLRRVAARQVLIFRRKSGRRRKLIEQVAHRAPSLDPARSPLDWLIAEERQSEVRAALTRLATADAEILLWKYRDDWKTHEIAQKLKLTESAAEARLHRARGRLRAELLGTGVDDASE